MSKQQRKSNNPNGRPRGVPNRATANAREAIARFVDGNSHKLAEWLETIEKEQGALAAFKCFTEVVEYHVPKLARTEHSGPDGKEIPLSLKIEHVDPAAK